MEMKDLRRLCGKLSAGLPGLLLIVTAATLSASAAFAAGPRVDFNIPAGDARSTLLQFYVQSGVQVLYLAEAVENITTRAVSGKLEASEALTQLLRDTNLVWEFETPTTAVVRARSSTARPKAGSAVDPATVEPAINAQPATFTPPAVYGAAPNLSEMSVTGTYIRGALDVISPLEVVTKEDMKRTAYASVQDAIHTLPLNFGTAQSEDYGGTGNFNRGSALNLRGLGAGATLVLVNGRRQPQAGIQADFVDVSNIPWSMVDRIEVLPDGTSALYGSDAIAGVVNIILRDSLEGSETQARLGTALEGAGETQAAQLFGHQWETGNWLFGYEYSKRTALAAADRDYAADTDKTLLGGSNRSSFRSSPGNIIDPATFQPAFAIPGRADGASLTVADLLPGVVNYQNRNETLQLLPEKEIHSGYLTLRQRLGERLELFAEGRYTARDTHWQGPADERIFVVPASNPWFIDPFGGRPFVIVAYNFLNDLGPVVGKGTVRNYSGTAGIRAAITPDWQATLSASYGSERMAWIARNQIALDGRALDAALADSNPATAFNPFGGGGSNNPLTLLKIQGEQRSQATSEIMTAGAVADGPLFDLYAGTAKLAVGLEARREELGRVLIGRDMLYRPQQFGREIAAAFTELSVPLLGNPEDSRALPRLELSLAGRYEEYSDFGSTFNPKVGLRWIPTGSTRLRASWGTSFKAPKLVDLYDVSQTLATLTVYPDPRAPTGQSMVMARTGSNPALHEETASAWTMGVDLTPVSLPGLTVSLTGYSIRYKDQVIQPGGLSPFSLLVDEARWSDVIVRNPGRELLDGICDSPEYTGSVAQCRATSPAALIDLRLRNFASSEVQGIDIKASHSFDTARGHFNVDLSGSHLLGFRQAFTAASPLIDVVNTVNNPLATRFRASVEWSQRGASQAGFSASLAADYTGSYSNRDNRVHPNVGSWITIDSRLGYRTGDAGGGWWDEVEMGLNAVNLFDKDPPFVDSIYGYDPVNADPMGRVVSFYIQKSWGQQ